MMGGGNVTIGLGRRRVGPTRRVLAMLTALAAAFPSVEAAAAPPAAAVEWRAAAREDVEAAFAAFRDRHPGMFDPGNPGFPEQLRRARDAALAFAERAGDAEGHMRALALFSAGLGDGHARAQASYSGRGEVLWPGFTTIWRGDALHVLDPVEGGAPRGSVLLDCDGRAARDLIRDLAFLFYGRPDEAGQWWTDAPYLFDRPRSPYETLPRACSFLQPGGGIATHRLDWRPMPDAVRRARFETAARRDPIGLTEPRPGIHRISLSSFAPDDEGGATYARLFAELEAGAERIAAGRAIVIDLRRNNGGSSSWSREVAERLWGEAAVTAALADYFRQTRIWWLADPANIAHFRGAAERLRTQGRGADAERLNETVAGMAAARQRGERFYIEEFGARLAARARPARPRRLPPVYVITDGGCASACLDALDVFTRFPGVKLMGAPTSADSNYLDILFEPLPSGGAGIVMPTKIWIGRPRGSGEVYRPVILVTDLEWTTAAMLDHVERDLAR
jgi:hypothetical protein